MEITRRGLFASLMAVTAALKAKPRRPAIQTADIPELVTILKQRTLWYDVETDQMYEFDYQCR